MKRTGSMASWVPPAVTITRSPPRGRPGRSSAHAAAAMSSTGASLPEPTSPQASRPLSGPTSSTPRPIRRATFSRVTSAVHMPVFMAGATRMGAFVASKVVDRRSSAMPAAIFAMTFAVAGATSTRSASWASEMWWIGSSGSSKSPMATRSPVRARKVVGPTKRAACSVMRTLTRQPAFCRSRSTSHDL